jgi:uncharacterized RDD family membrane protein YckC
MRVQVCGVFWRRLAVLVGLLAVGAGRPAAEQLSVEAAPAAGRRVLVSATEDRLWLARMEHGRGVLSFRMPSGPAVGSAPFDRVILSLAAVERQAYAFHENGEFYRYVPGGSEGVEGGRWTPELNLPERKVPLEVVEVAGGLYALVPTALTDGMAMLEGPVAPATTRPFEPGPGLLTLVRYTPAGWFAVATCPPPVTAEALPRACYVSQRLLLFWRNPEGAEISYVQLDPAVGVWELGGTLGLPGLRDYWVAVVNRAATIVAEGAARDGRAAVQMYTLLGEAGESAEQSWQRGEFEMSPLPDGHEAAQVRAACGFNQHLALLVTTVDGGFYLRFGRRDGAPTMATQDVFAEPLVKTAPVSFHLFRTAAMLTILVALFVFRRQSVVMPAALPAGYVPAFILQRLAAFVIDALPFSVAAALVLRVSWIEAGGQIVAWAVDPQINESGLPGLAYVLWWFLAAGGYTVYSFVMELVAGRTVGKVLLRLRIMTDTGRRPVRWQLVVRNLMRIVEVMPPFWILNFLVLLSRNRQRAGDIFAGTVMVRWVGPEPGERSAGDESGEQ